MVEHALQSTPLHSSLLWLIPFLPAFGALFNGLTGRKLRNNALVDGVALGTVGLAFALSVYMLVLTLGQEPGNRGVTQDLWIWLELGSARVLGGLASNTLSWGYRFDVLSGAMALLVTGVGFLIHLFSTGYMSEERKNGQYYRFMAYLNLFVFSMLNLVLGSNIVMMFLGWEGVGLCSYLLIGFYFDQESAAIAGKKAFVTNRIGDFGFMLGFFLLFMLYGSVDFATLMGMTRELLARPEITLFGVSHTPTWWFNLVGCCLFVGACGKSAQIPLYVWLPDAMAGPTPVSALIHAATMVTSGLYMICRMSFVYANAPLALEVVLGVGALTALVAASMGLAQYDIKKVLAYSTVSQLGFMFMGMGAGAFSVGMFHVFTHAFFKAALFLGSGSVIMACHHEQDMRNMGGLRKHLPWTFASMLLATLAIAGIFPFSGFFSKDEILWKVFEGWWVEGHLLNLTAWLMGVAAAFMTAFYMTRLMVMTFWGDYRGNGHDPYGHRKPAEHHHHHADPHTHHIDDQADHDAVHAHHPHEAGAGAEAHRTQSGPEGAAHDGPREVRWNMWLPVAILAGLAVVAGAWNVPHSLGGHSSFSAWLSPLIFAKHGAEGHGAVPWIEYALMVFSVAWALGAMSLAWWIYGKDPAWSKAKGFVQRFPDLFRWVHHKYYVDEFYEAAIIGPCKRLGERLWSFDGLVVDGAVNGAAKLSLWTAEVLRWVDVHLVDGSVNFVAWLLQQLSLGFKSLQSGKVQNYAYVMFAGFLTFAFWKFLF